MGLMDYLNITPAATEQASKSTGVSAPPSSALNDKVALPAFGKANPQGLSPSTDVDYDKLIREKGYYGAFQSLNKKPDFEAEEKRTRRARELALLGDVANLGGQALASAMGARRFTPINSQVPRYNERLQRLRDAQRAYDMDFNNKSLSMIFKDYGQKRADDALKAQIVTKQAAADLKYKRDLTIKQIDQAFQSGMLDAKGKQALEQQASRAKDARALAALSHKYRLGEISAQKKGDDNKIVDSVIGGDGNIYTRNTRLTENEAKQLVLGSGASEEDLAPFVVKESAYDTSGKIVTKEKTDWWAAVAYVLQKGMIGADELQGRGFKTGSNSSANNVTASGQQVNNKTGLLLPR